MNHQTLLVFGVEVEHGTIHTNSQSSLFFLIDLIQVHIEKQDREKGEHQLISSELQMCSPKKKKKGVLFWWVDLFIVRSTSSNCVKLIYFRAKLILYQINFEVRWNDKINGFK